MTATELRLRAFTHGGISGWVGMVGETVREDGDVDTRAFYDSLAETYHALYPDWERELTEQAAALVELLGALPDGASIADTACGIGTQLIGLAAAGYRMFGSDISPMAVDRARAESAIRGLRSRLAVADMRALPWAHASMDAVICADNAVPHLLTDHDVARAFAEIRRVLRPGARAVVTTRDYDAVAVSHPSSTPPQVMVGPDRKRIISFQLWSWRGTSDIYDLEHFQLRERDPYSWQTTRRSATYRAYARDHLSRLAVQAGLVDITWRPPSRTRYFQPAMTATRPST
jgi:glycine/sarcosine N-methyltransferase